MKIQRIRPTREYEVENIILSCPWCNNEKSDEFSLWEFKEVARGINFVCNQRLGNEIVNFPENTYSI